MITIENLHKKFGKVNVLRGLDLQLILEEYLQF